MSRSSLAGALRQHLERVRPSISVNVIVFTGSSVAGSGSAPSYISVVTMRSSGTISRYSPWNATSKPLARDHHVAPAAADAQVDLRARHLAAVGRSTSA